MRTLTAEDIAGLPLPDRSPRRGRGYREAAGLWQLSRLGLHAPRLALTPRGSGRPVIDLPGWRAAEGSMAPLRSYLRSLGHSARPWGLGRNLGDVRRDVDVMVERVATTAAMTDDQVALVGWSLGGTIAREVARQVPQHVRRVITFGSPIVGLPAFTVVSRTDPATVAGRLHKQAEHERANPITVPITTIYTRRDRVVAWPASIDRFSADVEHIEVSSTHLSLGIDPDVWRIVATRLAG